MRCRPGHGSSCWGTRTSWRRWRQAPFWVSCVPMPARDATGRRRPTGWPGWRRSPSTAGCRLTGQKMARCWTRASACCVTAIASGRTAASAGWRPWSTMARWPGCSACGTRCRQGGRRTRCPISPGSRWTPSVGMRCGNWWFMAGWMGCLLIRGRWGTRITCGGCTGTVRRTRPGRTASMNGRPGCCRPMGASSCCVRCAREAGGWSG